MEWGTHGGRDTRGVGHILSGAEWIRSGTHTEWNTHGVEHTRSETQTEWNTQRVRYTKWDTRHGIHIGDTHTRNESYMEWDTRNGIHGMGYT